MTQYKTNKLHLEINLTGSYTGVMNVMEVEDEFYPQFPRAASQALSDYHRKDIVQVDEMHDTIRTRTLIPYHSISSVNYSYSQSAETAEREPYGCEASGGGTVGRAITCKDSTK